MRLTIFLRIMKNPPKVGEITKQRSNLPESYIKRSMEKIIWKTPKGVQYRRAEIKRVIQHFGIRRPWEDPSDLEMGKIHKKVFVEPIEEWSFFNGDRVEVMVGKDKGKQGIINYVVQERNWVIVEGLNCDYVMKGKMKTFPGVLVKEEQPLLVTGEVMLLDPSDEKPSEVEWRYDSEGKRVRVSKRTGRIIPIPRLAEETVDYKTKASYVEQPKDTPATEVTKVTFTPALKTFEMDIAEKMGIREDRVPAKTYWYHVHPIG